jgi:prepilin-type N-terminal cleavage/methylation domain-containing protein
MYNKGMKKSLRGFTLIELLVVIAIISILSVVVILTLNPAELLRQARDSNRIADMSTMKTAIGQYLADVSSPVLGDYANCGESNVTSTGVAHEDCGFTTTYWRVAASSSRAVDGTGWIPVDFTDISSGAPIGTLPVDPTNSGPNVYRYAASSSGQYGLVYELNAIMESTKQTGAGGAALTDGGTDASTTIFSAGTAPGLAL